MGNRLPASLLNGSVSAPPAVGASDESRDRLGQGFEGDGRKLHINLWLAGGKAPSDGREVEIVIKDMDLPGE